MTSASSAPVQSDGTFSLVVLPGPGVVGVAAAPRHEYAAAAVSDEELARLTDSKDHQGLCSPGRFHALSLIHPSEGTEKLTLDFTVGPARPLEGWVVGPDGKPMTGVRVVGLTAMPEEVILETPFFTVTGLNPQSGRALYFHHREAQLRRVLALRGDETGPLTVQLGPSGSVVGRLVDRKGNPLAGVRLTLKPSRNGPLVTSSTDPEGEFRAALVPGETYTLELAGSQRLLKDVGPIAGEPGRRKVLGDIPLDR